MPSTLFISSAIFSLGFASSAHAQANLDIINGRPATGKESWAPAVVGIASKEKKSYSIFCTGTILNESSVVTAAHCLEDLEGEKFYVVFGLKEKDIRDAREVKSYVVHEAYDPKAPEEALEISDIGLIRFDGGLPEGAEPAEIVVDEKMLKAGMPSLVAGYGVTNAKAQTGSGTLRYGKLKIIDPGYGKHEAVTDESITATCNGDSGGPAMIEGPTPGQYLLWGVTSRGYKRCNKEGWYTKISSFVDWIARHQ